MNNKIEYTLKKLLNHNRNLIKDLTLNQFVNDFREEVFSMYYVNTEAEVNKYFEEQEENIRKVLSDYEVEILFKNLINPIVNEENIVNNFILDIIKSFKVISEELKNVENNFSNQVIFIEYSDNPYAWFNGFGPGNYKVLDKPEYFDFNPNGVFSIKGNVDFSEVWKNKILFEEKLEDLDSTEMIFQSNYFSSIVKFYKYKFYLLLHKAFSKIELSQFYKIKVQKPLYVYVNEFGCERMNVFVFE